MGILKVCLKFPFFPYTLPPITLLDTSFAHSPSTWLRGVRGEKYKIVKIAVFRMIFVTDCSLF